jgi:hypothetical protein
MKRITKIGSFLILLASVFAQNLIAQDLTKVGTTSADFLMIEAGARAQAMGGAYIGVADDATALYWNAAGAGLIGKGAAQYQFGKRFADITHHFMGVTYPLTDEDVIGFSVQYLDYGEMEVTTIEEPEGTGETFSASSIAINLSYAKQLTDRVYVGFTGKYIYEEIWLEHGSGFAFDISTMYDMREIGVRIGMTISNLGPEMGIDEGPHLTFYKQKPDDYPGSPQPESQLVTQKFPLPTGFALGISSVIVGVNSPFVQSGEHKVLLAASINDYFNAPFRGNLGVEYGWQELIFLRGGYRIGYDTQKLSLGFGLDFYRFTNQNIRLDYVWVDYDDLGGVNIWSLEFRF